jgi:hypothetical protein
MVAGVEAALLQQQAGNLLGPLGQLGAGEGLGGRPPAVEQGEEGVVGGGGGPPAQDLSDELMLFAAAGIADCFVL